MDDTNKALRERETNLAREFLLDHKEMILEWIRGRKIATSSLKEAAKKNPFGALTITFATIKRIESLELQDIQVQITRLGYTLEKAGTVGIPLFFLVKLNVSVSISPSPFPLFPREVLDLAPGAEPESSRLEMASCEQSDQVVDVEYDYHLQGSATLTSNAHKPLTDLVLRDRWADIFPDEPKLASSQPDGDQD